ncbi:MULTISPECIES: TetR/AcrR family transcriptional regulator [Bifidobacterium]|jgi:AcrR family transcriptional regulator|uniref:TetR family transcriptional regulator n=1 Tax=Bifidobacterium subtile TaxID=77635 RepID=A0A087EB09_9BIFI|nr:MULTISPECIES: TetR/AcrR family transcriptional regulator [Bifidobacterium]KFJ04960.1 TetR family transcriptional regulator [Bifidobacterium subtile]MCI1223383.1 TetR/AcrR family transcriptional regulator [Bifidobacterium subtile]MCI1258118.1 TetR/AcrR family transcriptional regulator [Bifidobacterium subtile]MCI1649687.1 TetR/AcrR family transcriptional regulator [Bifidobacterium tibiigranuli]MCI2186553.1 TetR/AcrR family transcriptional regulator [Bifidobacterium tibiigranuli]
MPTQTFFGLGAAKRERIEQALLHEFSSHPLCEAQVARIVRDAGIARGAFYVYFDDLDDAYRCALAIALRDIHGGLIDALQDSPDDTLDVFYRYTSAVVHQMTSSPYADLLRLHWQINEDQLQGHDEAAGLRGKMGEGRSEVERFFGDHPLIIAGQPLRDSDANCVAVRMLTQASHCCVRDVLAGKTVGNVMADFAMLLQIMRDGLRCRAGNCAESPVVENANTKEATDSCSSHLRK